MYKHIIVLSLLGVIINANLIGWRNCGKVTIFNEHSNHLRTCLTFIGSHLADIHAMRIANCTQTPCVFQRGESYMIEVEASSRKLNISAGLYLTIINVNTGANSYTLPFVSVATIFGMPFTLFQGDACDHLSLGNCPARNGYSFAFRLLFEMPSGLPAVLFLLLILFLCFCKFD